jgi:hypothetical protein
MNFSDMAARNAPSCSRPDRLPNSTVLKRRSGGSAGMCWPPGALCHPPLEPFHEHGAREADVPADAQHGTVHRSLALRISVSLTRLICVEAMRCRTAAPLYS